MDDEFKTFEVWLAKRGERAKNEGEEIVKDKWIGTIRMQLTSLKALQRHDWQAIEQVSLTDVVHLEFIQGELKYLY